MSKQKVNCAKGTREADLGHAVLSASGSHRWLNCTPSARLELEFENTTSEAAREGTAAHALCEHKLKKFLKKRSKRPVSDYNSDEMHRCLCGICHGAIRRSKKVLQRSGDSH